MTALRCLNARGRNFRWRIQAARKTPASSFRSIYRPRNMRRGMGTNGSASRSTTTATPMRCSIAGVQRLGDILFEREWPRRRRDQLRKRYLHGGGARGRSRRRMQAMAERLLRVSLGEAGFARASIFCEPASAPLRICFSLRRRQVKSFPFAGWARTALATSLRYSAESFR